jgi:uncharacterized protein YkwD
MIPLRPIHPSTGEAEMTHPLRTCLALAALGLILGRAAADPKPAPAVKPSEEESAVLDLANKAREKEKLPPLKQAGGTLIEVARAHSANMARQGKLAHELDGKSPRDRVKESGYPFGAVGENIVYGPRLTPEQAFDIWMNSPPHKANILNKEFEELAVGMARDDKGNVFFTQVFIIPEGKVPSGPGPELKRFVEAANKLSELIGKARQKEKVPPLKPDRALMRAALEHTLAMAQAGKLEHLVGGKKPHQRVPKGSYDFEVHSACIASTAELQPADVFAGWMDSRDDRADILGDRYQDFGVGIGVGARGEVYYTLLFGTRRKDTPRVETGPLDEKFVKEATQTVLELTNEARAKEKLPPLKLNELLSKAATAHSANMGRKGELSHKLDGKLPTDRVEAAGYDYAWVGENIAFTQVEPPEKIVQRWLDSPPHRAQIMNDKFREMGVGIVRNDKGEIYYTQVFGTARPKR